MLINLTKKYTPFLAYTFSSEVKIKTSKKLAISTRLF